MITTINNAIAKKREEGEKGFTLIELLVVILIIGVLAAIAIPAFLNSRSSAWEAAVKADIANAALAAEQYAVENDGYAGLDTAELTSADSSYNPTPDVTVTIALTGNTFTLTGRHANLATDQWVFDSATGVTTKGTVPAGG